MSDNLSERLVVRIPTEFSAEEFAQYAKIRPDSSPFEALEEALPLIKQYAEPAAVIKWVPVDSVEGDVTVIEGVPFRSKVVADKLRDFPRVFVSVVTAGAGLEKCPELEDDPFIDIYNGGLIYYASRYLIDYLRNTFGYDGSSVLNPGSLPDWPIANNFGLFKILGGAEEIGCTLNDSGYIKPWNSGSHIHFAGDGYQNCNLCRNYGCVGRHGKFDPEEYRRIFGTEP